MNSFLTILSLLFVFSATASASPKDPLSTILISCRSQVVTEKSVQVYGNLTDQGLNKVSFTQIDVWNHDVAPIHRANEVWTIDKTYKPTAKYRNYNRYVIQEGSPTSVRYEVLIPTRAEVYMLAEDAHAKSGRGLEKARFKAVYRYRDDFQTDLGGQEFLTCESEWISF